MTTTPTLGTRDLNRATLDRQLLLRRSPMDPADAVAHPAGNIAHPASGAVQEVRWAE